MSLTAKAYITLIVTAGAAAILRGTVLVGATRPTSVDLLSPSCSACSFFEGCSSGHHGHDVCFIRTSSRQHR